MSDFPCAAGCGARVRIDRLRCAPCVRTGAVFEPVPAPPAAAATTRTNAAADVAPRRWSTWRCACGGAGLEEHPLHALFAFYVHRRRCELLARAVALAG